MGLTRYQSLIVKYLEAEYGRSICEVFQYFREMPLRWKDIAGMVNCTLPTLRAICKAVGYNDKKVVILNRMGYLPNATDFLKSFDTVEKAVIHCRKTLELTGKETNEKLGISDSTRTRHTPNWLKYTFNFRKDRF